VVFVEIKRDVLSHNQSPTITIETRYEVFFTHSRTHKPISINNVNIYIGWVSHCDMYIHYNCRGFVTVYFLRSLYNRRGQSSNGLIMYCTYILSPIKHLSLCQMVFYKTRHRPLSLKRSRCVFKGPFTVYFRLFKLSLKSRQNKRAP
jgi:hypothetical protein